MSDFDAVVDGIWQRGKAAWPALFVDKTTARSLVTVSELPPHASDLYLALGCAIGDPVALKLFDDGVLADAARAIRRYDASHGFVTEVMQRIRIHLLIAEGGPDDGPPRIARYDGRASLRAWVGTCAVRMTLYVMRTARNAKEVAVEWPDVIAELPTGHAELDAVRMQYADAFRTAWRAACAQLTPRHRTILRMCFVEGASIDHIAKTYAVHRVTVWRWLEDAKTSVLAETRSRLGELIPASGPGTQSLLSLIGSQLDLGLSVLT